MKTNQTEWQSIETAPTDGTEIIAWNKTHGERICSWTGHDYNGEFEEGFIYFEGFGTYKFQPKKWKPLPAKK